MNKHVAPGAVALVTFPNVDGTTWDGGKGDHWGNGF